MKIAALIQRILLGLIFLLYGLNGFIRFTHPASFRTPIAREYMTVMQATPYAHVLFALQIVCGMLLIADFFVPVALTILAGYIFNIYMFHIFLEPSLTPSTVMVTVLWVLVFVRNRNAFRPLLRPLIPAAWQCLQSKRPGSDPGLSL